MSDPTRHDGDERDRRPGAESGRRAFLGRIAAGAAATAAMGAGLDAAFPRVLGASVAPTRGDGAAAPDAEHWLDGLKGKHRQLFDAFAPNEGFPLAFAATFLATQGPNPDAGAVIVLRHGAAPLALDHSLWEKYKIGQAFNVNDPATKAIAVRNPFVRPQPGVLLTDEMAVDRLLSRGVIIGVCDVALTVLSGKLGEGVGVAPEAAYKEWVAGVVPGIAVLPSGVWGVNRAQEKGCTYCSGG